MNTILLVLVIFFMDGQKASMDTDDRYESVEECRLVGYSRAMLLAAHKQIRGVQFLCIEGVTT